MSADKPKKVLIPRITQLDAKEFDEEMQKILFNQLMDIAAIFCPGTLNSNKPEINFFLNLIIFKYSVLKNRSTFGQDLLGLKYDDSLRGFKIFLYPFLKYLFPYIKNKYEDNIGRVENIEVINVMKKIEFIIKFGSFLNMLIFLREGKYPTLTDRLLGLKYIQTENFNRTFGYSLMMRQLLWHGFMELLINITPLLSYKIIKQKFKKFIFPSLHQTKVKSFVEQNTRMNCVICNNSPVLPCVVSMYCSHIACYYCIRGVILEDEKYICPECNEPNPASNKTIFL